MSGSLGGSWSSNPNTPRIPRWLYTWEKAAFGGYVVGLIFYGIVVALFVQCINALLQSTDRTRGSMRWGLTAHTVAMFCVVTMSVAVGLYPLPVSYINNREFPGNNNAPPGPYGYGFLPKFTPITVAANSAIQVNQWLVDGLLLYRCYVIYGMNYWVVAFPFIMYLATWAIGIVYLYVQVLPFGDRIPDRTFGTAYYSIALSLNVLLTFMIITRLALHHKNMRSALGAQNGASGLYKTIIVILVESGALYAASFLLLLGPWAARSVSQLVTFQLLPEVQVIAPFLLVLRIANRDTLTDEGTVSGNLDSIRFNSMGGSTGVDRTIPDGNPIDSTLDAHGETPGEHAAGAEGTIKETASR